MYQLAAYTHFEQVHMLYIKVSHDNTKEHYRVIRMYGGRKCTNLQRIHISKQVHMLIY